MAVPRNRHSVSRRNTKRAHDFKTPKTLATCTNCKALILPHRACASCGQYKGRNYGKVESTET